MDGAPAEAGTNGAPPDAPASPRAVAVTVGPSIAKPKAVVGVINTCCGEHLSAPHTVGPFLKYWGLERLPGSDKQAPAPASVPVKAGPGPAAEQREQSAFASPAGRFPSYMGPKSQELQGRPAIWVGSVLVVTQADMHTVALQLQDEAGAPAPVPSGPGCGLSGPVLLDSFDGWSAVRFMLRLPVRDQGYKVHYNVTVEGQPLNKDGPYCFHLAGLCEATHWGYYSCSGFTSDVPSEKRVNHWKGVRPLWDDVAKVHSQKPLHLLVGGGDQLYNDDVWQLPVLKPFLDLRREVDRPARQVLPFTQEMETAVNEYYFHHYCKHFSIEPIGTLYASIPQVMSWDDHDIFDGWGSYPHYLQSSTVFQGVFDIADRWYCVFQQHCTRSEKAPVSVYEVGGATAVVTLDQRHRRAPHQILPLEHYMDIALLGPSLPEHVKHVVFVFTVPVVYPHVSGAQKVLWLAKNEIFNSLLGRLGVDLMSQFGEPELMDDLDDHWTAKEHRDERRFLVENLQLLAKYRGCRVTMLSGDVHVCGVGQLYSHPEPPDAMLKHDFRYMVQVISSAIANPPPPGGLMKVLEFFAGSKKINKSTRLKMCRLIRNRMGVRKPLENARNWCTVTEHLPSDTESPGCLTFTLRVEVDAGDSASISTHPVVVPPLERLPNRTAAQDPYFDPFSVSRLERVGCSCFG